MEDLISKKELLAIYQISYGALYRWKRMGLIPEEWFIKKATVTGQETFFPRSLVCRRVEQILASNSTLTELAKELASDIMNCRALIIETAFGKKIFYFHEIKSVTVDDGDGHPTDITKNILKGR